MHDEVPDGLLEKCGDVAGRIPPLPLHQLPQRHSEHPLHRPPSLLKHTHAHSHADAHVHREIYT